jgi:hypothetical protein
VAKGHGKTWTKDETDLMLQLEQRYKGEGHVANKMLAHLPRKTNKQIRDKRNEKTYKRLVHDQEVADTAKHAADLRNNSPRTPTAASSTLEIQGPAETSPDEPLGRITRRAGTEAEQAMQVPTEDRSDERSGHTIRQAEAVADRPETDADTINWTNSMIDQTLGTKAPAITNDENYQNYMSHITTILRQVSMTGELPTQQTVDEVYDRLVTIIQPKKSNRRHARKQQENKTTRNKRRKKRYAYGRYQELYKRNPGLLAKHIRDDDERLDVAPNNISPTEIKSFFTSLWGNKPAIAIPFQQPETDLRMSNETTNTITNKEINMRLRRIKNGTSPGPDGTMKKDISGNDI